MPNVFQGSFEPFNHFEKRLPSKSKSKFGEINFSVLIEKFKDVWTPIVRSYEILSSDSYLVWTVQNRNVAGNEVSDTRHAENRSRRSDRQHDIRRSVAGVRWLTCVFREQMGSRRGHEGSGQRVCVQRGARERHCAGIDRYAPVHGRYQYNSTLTSGLRETNANGPYREIGRSRGCSAAGTQNSTPFALSLRFSRWPFSLFRHPFT